MIDNPRDGLEAFRQGVVEFLRDTWVGGADCDIMAFRRAATDRGYLYRNIPREYGGSEQPNDPWKALLIAEEFARVRAPRELANSGVRLLAPTLLACGSQWQKAHFIPRIISGEDVWCQGYSEPGSGSDLAAVRTKGELVGDEWIINGQKIWTGNAHKATHIFALVRTEPNAGKHDGISYLLVDLRQPGITIRPIMQITGHAEFNEVFFDDVRTPKDWIVGERGQGWNVSRTTLAVERNTVGGADATAKVFEKLIVLAGKEMYNGKPAIEDEVIRDEMARIHGMVAAHRANAMQQMYAAGRGEQGLPAGGSITKLYNSTILEKVALCAQKIIGPEMMLDPVKGGHAGGPWRNQFFSSIAAQIGGGTSNIQRNIIAERGLGLPRDEAG